MRRASVSDPGAGATHPFGPWSRRSVWVLLTGAAVVAASVLASASTAAATGDTGEGGAGSLELNADVLVDEAVGGGATGEFVVRGRLFSEEFSARAAQERAAAESRLGVVESLGFERVATSADEYGEARGALFAEYTPTATSGLREAAQESSMLPILALTAGVPVVLVGGAWVGKTRARRKKVSA